VITPGLCVSEMFLARVKWSLSLIGIFAVLVSSFILYPDIYHAPVVIIVVLIVYKHSTNIANLLTGREKRVV